MALLHFLGPWFGRSVVRAAAVAAVGGALSLVAGCASAGAPEAASPDGETGAEAWAAKKAAIEAEQVKRAPRGSADPLEMNSELEESAIPKTVITPKSQVRRKSPRELNAAMSVVRSSSSVEGAAKKLTQRLGKPSWTESPKGQEKAKRRVWVAPAGKQCHRLVLDPDGTATVETASQSEWRMLAATARQNPCSGVIKRGLSP